MFKETLKLYTQLYEDSIPTEKDSLEELQEKAKKYDINPDLNYQIMIKMLKKNNLNEKDSQTFCDFYENYVQTLFYKQKNEINDIIKKQKYKEIKNLITNDIYINDKSFIDCYFEIIHELRQYYNNKNIKNFKYIEDLFTKFYYVDNYEINQPLIYGSNELIFGGLINNLYLNLFDNNNNVDNNNVDIEENMIKKNDDFNNYPRNIMKKSNKNSKAVVNYVNKLSTDMDIDNESSPVNKKPVLFDKKIEFLVPYLNKISDEEFKQIFNLENIKKEEISGKYEVKPKFNALTLHLLFLDLIFYIYTIFKKKYYMFEFDHNFFFELKSEKMIFFELIPKEEIIITDDQGNEIKSPENIENKNYIIYNKKNQKESTTFNPYDYCLNKIYSCKNYKGLIQFLSDPNNFSLNKFFKENKLFNSEKLTSIFNKNIIEMLTTKSINELFDQHKNFKGYICPYSGETQKSFLKQLFNIILYLPIPFKNIAGFTYKQFGVIFISNNNRLEKQNIKKNIAFCKRLNKISFIKNVHIHEIISHYSCTIVHSNNETISISTPTNTFTEYIPNEIYEDLYNKQYDGGDRAESVLFGNKIKYISPKGALFLLNNDNYENDLETFRKEFIEINFSYNNNELLDLQEESKKNEFIKQIMIEDESIENKIIIVKKCISSFREMNALEEEEDEDDDDNENNILQLVSCFERPRHIFRYYKKMHK